jgi:hypothetical protein
VSDDSDHLADLSDGAGCAEVWEHLSAERADAESEGDPDDGSAAATGGEVDSEDAITPDSNPTDSSAATAATADADAAADESSEGETTDASYV